MIRLLLGLVVLHVVTAAPLPFESVPRPQAWLQASADLAMLMLLACALGNARPRWSAAVLAVLTALVPLYRFGETLMPTFYGKAFEPWVDLLEVPGLLHLLAHERSTPVQVLMYAAGIAAACVCVWLFAVLWRPWLAACARPGFALRCAGAVQLALGCAFVVREASGAALRPSMFLAALRDLRATVATPRWHGNAVVQERVRAAKAELAALPDNLDGLARADVFILIVESYGRSLLGTVDGAWAADLREHEAALAVAGWRCAAGWMAPSVRGGGSTLAHAELLSGIAVEDRLVFDHLLASSVRTLAAIARDAGYHTVDVQPAMPRAWPEAKALGFAQDLFHHAFGYDGFAYPWGRMPDQFALQRVLAEVVHKRDRPLFVQYVGVSSHAPFHTVPPYHSDWARAADAAAFAAPAARWDITWTTYAGHPQVHEAYLASIRYALRVSFDFALQLRDPALVLVLGDHQPPLPYAERADRVRDVPIHLLANRPELIEPWLGAGLREGLQPDPDGVSFPGARFLFRFLRAYGR